MQLLQEAAELRPRVHRAQAELDELNRKATELSRKVQEAKIYSDASQSGAATAGGRSGSGGSGSTPASPSPAAAPPPSSTSAAGGKRTASADPAAGRAASDQARSRTRQEYLDQYRKKPASAAPSLPKPSKSAAARDKKAAGGGETELERYKRLEQQYPADKGGTKGKGTLGGGLFSGRKK